MKKAALLSSLFLFLAYTAFAQSHRVTSAWNHLQHEEYEQAYEAIEKAIEHPRTKDDAQAWYYRGSILMTLAGTEEYRELHANPVETQLDAYESFKKAHEYDSRGRYEQEILQSIEGLALNFFNVGVEFYNEQQYAQSNQFFENYLEALELLGAEKDMDGVFYSGYSAYMSENYELAKERFSTLIDEGYDDEAPYSILTEYYLEQEKDTSQALKMIEKGRDQFPASERLILTQVDIYVQQNRVDELITELENAIEEYPENYDLRFVLATAYDQVEKSDKALEQYRVVTEGRPDDFDANYNLGAMLFNKGARTANKAIDAEDDEKAKKYDEEAKEIFNEARPYLEKAHELDDEHRHTMISLRQVYFRIDEADQAQRIDNRLEELYGEGLQDDQGAEGEIEQR